MKIDMSTDTVLLLQLKGSLLTVKLRKMERRLTRLTKRRDEVKLELQTLLAELKERSDVTPKG